MFSELEQNKINSFKSKIGAMPSCSCDISDIESTLRTIDPNKKTLLTVVSNGVEFDFLISLKYIGQHNKTIVFGSGAVPKTGIESHDAYMELLKIPFFSRLTWDNVIPYNLIWLSDVSKKFYAKSNSEISLGWNVGTKEHWFLKTIGDILNIVFDFFGLNVKSTLFYGSSGGGSQAMELCSIMSGQYAMADCPQFDFTLHHCFKALKNSESDIQYILKNEPYRYDVVKCFSKFRNIPHLIINEPFSDGDFSQFVTFLKNIKQELNDLNDVYNVENGRIKVQFILKNEHAYLSQEEFIQHAKSILK